MKIAISLFLSILIWTCVPHLKDTLQIAINAPAHFNQLAAQAIQGIK